MPNPIVLDLGANIGLSALALHWQLPRARILAVEPDAANFELLCKNTAGIGAITPLRAAASARDGWVTIANPEENRGFLIRVAPCAVEAAKAIPAYSVETLLRMAAEISGSPSAAPLLIKMDIEGSEREIFSQECPWLDMTPLLIVEPHDYMFPGESISHGLLGALTARHGDVFARADNLICLAPPRRS